MSDKAVPPDVSRQMSSALAHAVASGYRSAARTLPTGGRVNDLVDAVLVVSVRTFTDRIEHMRAEMARFGIEFEWVFDFDPPQITPELIERTFAPSDLRLPHQSAVLKHIATWRICVERGYRRVLVFEDDVVLSRRFTEVLAKRSPTMLVPGGPLPAAEALVLDRESCVRRLQWLERNKVTRPPDWLLREVDAELAIPHFWLRDPVVEQGSMNGRFHSLLDEKRRGRGLIFAWLRFRWDRLCHRLFGGRTISVDNK